MTLTTRSLLVSAASLGLGCALLAAPLAAHEYWLDPLDATPDAGGTLFAHIRNGEGFDGRSLALDPARLARAEIVDADGERALYGRTGQLPALVAALGASGPALLVVETRGTAIAYDEFEEFGEFVDFHGLSALRAAHIARGLPEEGVTERFYRYAKALVHVGEIDTAAAPEAILAPHGMRFELVPLADPVRGEELAFALWLDGAPLADAQVELFVREGGGSVASRRVARTGADGSVRFSPAGEGRHMVNAVQVLEPPAASDDAPVPHWESHWASLTFERRDGAR